MTGHEPVRPFGLCSACAQIWPCETLVTDLVDELGDGLPFSAALWDLFDQAAQVLPMPYLVLYNRCIRHPMRVARRRTAGAG